MRRAIALLAVLTSLTSPATAEQVVFSEVMYHPLVPKPEYLEILNLTSNRLDMAKWTLTGGIDFTFPDFNAGAPSAHFLYEYERIIVSSDTPAATRAAYPGIPAVTRVYGPWTGQLDNAGDSIVLRDATRAKQCELTYADRGKWPVAADGTGHSLVNIDSDRVIDDWRNWKASRVNGGSPGVPELVEAEEPVTGGDYSIPGSKTVFDYNQVWRWKGADVNPGTAWIAPAFDDSSWGTGKGILGFKPATPLTQFVRLPGMDSPGLTGQGGPDATEGLRTLLPRFINGVSAPQYMVYLFRTSFNYSGPLTGVSYAIDHALDDGAIYYLNGGRIGAAQRLVDNVTIVNLARTGTPAPTATQTTTVNPQAAALGIDGLNTNFTQTSNIDLAPSWTVNLNRTAAISTVNIHNRESGFRERLRDITITILEGATVLHTSPVLNPGNVLASPVDIVYDVAAANGGVPLLARSVRVSRTPDPTGGTGPDDASVLSLAEVMVRGTEAWNRITTAAVANPVEELSNITGLQGAIPVDTINGGTLLKAGLNVLAAEVHQSSAADTDMGFAARMRVTKPAAVATVLINEVKPGNAPGQGFVEFYNSSGAAVDLQGYYLTDTESNLTKYQFTAPVLVPALGLATVDFFNSNLVPASPMTIILTQPDGFTPQTGFRSASLPFDGRSIGRKPEGGALWRLFAQPTPGAANGSSLTTTSLLLNEVHFGVNGHVDWVEFVNPSAAPVGGAGLFVASRNDWTDKAPLPASVPASGYASAPVDFIPDGSGDVTLFLIDAQNNVLGTAEVTHRPGLDSVQRHPLTSGEWYNAAAATQNAGNSPAIHNEIVINEVMFAPPSSHEQGQFVEIVNRSGAPVNLTGWSFVDGINYDFPPGTMLGTGQLLVIAADPAYVTANYGVAALGPWSGSLRRSGEVLRLEDERRNLADMVDYRSGGQWPAGTSGEGSSMELMHPDMDNSQPSAWRASDESTKSTFQSYSNTGTYKQLRGAPTVTTAYRELLLNLVSDGHVVMRNIRLTRALDPGKNQLLGGDATAHAPLTPTAAINGLFCLGTHCMSDTLADGFHMISVGTGDTKANKVEVDVVDILPGDVLTLTFDARWVSGLPLLVAQTWDRSFGKVFRLPIPNNLGTPGTPNSRAIAAPAPTVDQMRHWPVVPTATQPVVVSARVASAAPLAAVSLVERIDIAAGNGPWITTPMNDLGSGGDATAGDGIWSATVAARPNATITQFYITATSNNGQSNECPRNAVGLPPVYGSVLETRGRPGMWIVSNSTPSAAPGTLTERFVLSLFDRNSLIASTGFSNTGGRDWDHPLMSNFGMNCTAIIGERDVYYNCEIRRGGSPWTRSSGNALDRARWRAPGDKSFRNRSKVTIDNDAAGLNRFHNRMVRYLMYLADYPVPDAEFIQQIVNADAPRVCDDQEQTDAEFFERAYERGSDGELFEIDDAWYMYDTGVHNDRLPADSVTGRWFLTDWTTPAAGANPSDESPIYFHGNWPVRFPEPRYDYSALSALIKVAYDSNTTIIPAEEVAFREKMERMIDLDRSAITAAVRGYCGDWDNFTLNRGKNGYFYRPPDGKFEFHHYDSDLAFQNTAEGWLGSAGGIGWTNYSSRPWFQQRMKSHLTRILTRHTLNSPRMDAFLQAMSYQAANSNPLAPFKTNLFSYPAWFRNRETNGFNFIGAANHSRTFAISTANGQTVATPLFLLAGDASTRVWAVDVAGHPEAVQTWVPTTANIGLWNISGIALAAGVNNLTVRALDFDGSVMATLPFTVTLSVDSPPVVRLTADPASWNIAANELFVLDATGSFDPDGGALSYAWNFSPSNGTVISHSVPWKTEARFLIPGLYTVTLTVTDPALSASVITREITVFSNNDFSPFGGSARLGPEFTVQNMELRDNFSPSAWYSVEDNTGRLEIQILDDSAKPMANPAFTHPLVTRDVPDTGDFSLQTDMAPSTREFGNFSAGLWLETTESGVAVKYAFAVEGGLNLNVYQASGAGLWTLLGGVPFTGDDATLRIVRTGNTLTFQRRVAGVWSTAFSNAIPAGSVAGRGGIFVATAQPTTVRMSFDYILVTDPANINVVLSSLRLTEIMYNPAGPAGIEFIELLNQGTQPINVDGVKLDNGNPVDAFTLPGMTLPPGQFCVLTNVPPATLLAAYPAAPAGRIVQWPGGSLNNAGERVTLRDANDNPIHDFVYDDDPATGWPTAPDGDGPSLEIISTALDYNLGSSWVQSTEIGGSPGWLGVGPDSDRDGSPDRTELLAGTDPSNPAHFFKPAATRGPGGVTVTWPTSANRSYLLQVSTTLTAAGTPGGWTTLTTITNPGPGTANYLDNTTGGVQREFYRVVITSP